jgi:hypothetical protein
MKLHEQVKAQKLIIEQYEEGLNDLRCYLNSSKFHVDTTVQVSDIMLRLDEVKHELFKLEISI